MGKAESFHKVELYTNLYIYIRLYIMILSYGYNKESRNASVSALILEAFA